MDNLLNNRKVNIWEWLFAFFLILDGNSVLHAVANVDYHLDKICTFCAFMLFMHTRQRGTKFKINYLIPILLFILLFYFVAKYQMVVKMPFVCMFFISLPCLIVYLYHAVSTKNYNLLYKIQIIIIVISIISIYFWIFGSLNHYIEPNCKTEVDWGGTKYYYGYYNIYYEAQDNMRIPFTDIIVCRNCAIFTEGPMFNLWLSISLFIEFFIRNKISAFRMVILLTALLTTFSTTGYIYIMILVIMKTYFAALTTKSSIKKYIYVLGVIVIAMICYIAYNSLMEDKSETISYVTRMNDYIEALELWEKNKIAGYGYGNVKYLFYASNREELGFSNTLLAILATGGVYMLSIFIFPVIILLLKKRLNIYKIEPPLAASFLYWSFTTIFFLRILIIFFLALLIVLAFSKDNYMVFSDNNHNYD